MVKKAYTANQNGVQLFSHVDVPLLANQNRASFTFNHSNSFSDLAAFLSAPPSDFPAKAEESSKFVLVGYYPDVFVWHQENKNTSSTSQRDVSLLKTILVSRNELREIANIGARDVDVLIANFLLQVLVREFLLLICVKKIISMEILVIRVINRSRHRNCFVRGYIHLLTCVKSPHSLLPRSFGFSLKQLVRTIPYARLTFYEVNYIDVPFCR